MKTIWPFNYCLGTLFCKVIKHIKVCFPFYVLAALPSVAKSMLSFNFTIVTDRANAANYFNHELRSKSFAQFVLGLPKSG